MKAILGLVGGTVIGVVAFFAIYFQQLLLVGQGRAGVFLQLQLSSAVNMYLFGGAILGLLFILVNKE